LQTTYFTTFIDTLHAENHRGCVLVVFTYQKLHVVSEAIFGLGRRNCLT